MNTELNLVYITEQYAGDKSTKEMVERLAVAKPSRTILAYIENGNARMECVTTDIKSGFFEIEISAANPAKTADALLALRIPELPTTMIWDNALSCEHILFSEIASHVERVIVSVVPPCGAAASLRSLLNLQNRLGSKAQIIDVAETMYRPWLSALARFLGDQAKTIHSLEMRCANDEITAEMLYVLAWTAASLNWIVSSFAWQKGEFDILYSGGQHARLRAVPSLDCSEITIECKTVDGIKKETIPEPPMEIRWEELLRMQLQSCSDDPIRKKTLVCVKDYLDAMETSTNSA